MNLAISNLAWPPHQDQSVATLLERLGVKGVELAPTKIWPDLVQSSRLQRQSYRRRWEQHAVRIVAAQSLLFGRPELVIFQDRPARAKTLAYLRQVVSICAELGAEALVFGSPKNRQIGSLDPKVAWAIAVEFFGALGEIAAQAGTVVVLEPNPAHYHADFVTHASQAIDLVEEVNHGGLRLHLDSACMTLAGDDPVASIQRGAALLWHFHISEPYLAPVGGHAAVEHEVFAQGLEQIGYQRWVSIEMREPEPFDIKAIEAAIARSSQWYGLGSSTS